MQDGPWYTRYHRSPWRGCCLYWYQQCFCRAGGIEIGLCCFDTVLLLLRLRHTVLFSRYGLQEFCVQGNFLSIVIHCKHMHFVMVLDCNGSLVGESLSCELANFLVEVVPVLFFFCLLKPKTFLDLLKTCGKLNLVLCEVGSFR